MGSYAFKADSSGRKTIGRFNAETRMWTQAGQLVSERYGHRAIFDGANIIVAGGGYTERVTEVCKILPNGQMDRRSCVEQSQLLGYSNDVYFYYPELYLVEKNFCKKKP